MIVKVGSLTVKVTFEIRIVCVIEVIQYNLSKVDTCQKWTKDFAPKYQFSGQSLIKRNLCKADTCLKGTKYWSLKCPV